jgi:hypothetical protein
VERTDGCPVVRLRGHLGDAVAHVLATSNGDIWVGYFDEAAASGEASVSTVWFASALTCNHGGVIPSTQACLALTTAKP